MPRLTRTQQKIFAGQATNNGVFGSLQSNDPVTSSDPATIQSRTAFLNGWNDATYSAEQLPPLEEFQSIQYIVTRQLAYMLQEGIPEWDVNTTYYKGSIVKVVSGSEYTLFESLIDNNTGNLTSDTTRWKVCGVSEDFNTGMHYWRADVTYGLGDWVRGVDAGGNPDIFQSLQANNKGNAVTNAQYWNPMGVGRGGFPLMTSIFYDHELNETNWLRADTWSWHDGEVYKSAYQALADAQSTGVQSSDLWTDYEVVGSPTITNGVVSNFSASNYVISNYRLVPGSGTWSIETKVNTSGASGTNRVIVGNPSTTDFLMPIIRLNTDGTVSVLLTSNGTSWDISLGTTTGKSTALLPLNQDVRLRLSFDGTKYTVSWSTDDWETQTDAITVNSSSIIYQGYGMVSFGENLPVSTEFWNGSISMIDTYITVDGVKVWQGAVNVPYTRAQNGWKIVSSSNAGYVQDMYESTGVAWYYIIDNSTIQYYAWSSVMGDQEHNIVHYTTSPTPENGDKVYDSSFQIIGYVFDNSVAGEIVISNSTGAVIGGGTRDASLDTRVNHKRFKLPRTKYGFTGLRDAVGNYVPESLPNITGEVSPVRSVNTTQVHTGAFSDSISGGYSPNINMGGNGKVNDDWNTKIVIDASDSSTTYQDNAPVQQRATQMYLYFYVGNTIRNQTEIDVGEITEALNNKWDSSNMQVVSALPENPQTGVFYFVT